MKAMSLWNSDHKLSASDSYPKNARALTYETSFNQALRHMTSSDGLKVHRWLAKQRVRARSGDTQGRAHPYLFDDLLGLLHHIAAWRPIDQWQSAPSKVRQKYASRVSELARDLAKALDESKRPSWPSAFHLFDPDVLHHALNVDPSYKRPFRAVIDSKANGGVFEIAATSDPHWPRQLERQQLVPLLLRLAEHVERARHSRVPDARPGTGIPNQRTLSRHLAEWFAEHYDGKVPHDQVANLVNAMVPSEDSPATRVTVRQWVR